MVYPVFEIKSISDRCQRDIDKYKNEILKGDNTIIQQLGLQLVTDINQLNTKEKMQQCIDVLKNKMQEISGKDMSDFNYSHDIKTYDDSTKNKLWIIRTYIFYQLLIFATLIMTNKDIYNSVFPQQSRTFRPDVTAELPNFKMGIFGSITPTSDIDIGIQYSGEKENFVALDYVVSIFEDMFIQFLGRTSLDLDIETYGDMMTLPNLELHDEQHADVFYLNTFDFVVGDFIEMLPYVGASILRNYITAYQDLGYSNEELKEKIKNFNWDEAFDYFYDISPKFKKIYDSYSQQLYGRDQWKEEAKNMVLDYFGNPYEDSRKKYYQYVKEAEESLQKVKGLIFHHKENLTDHIETNDILTIMKNIAKSLVYRAESYTCAPTVLHVVRVLQANKDSPLDYDTTVPVCIFPDKEAICELGSFGYIISMMEQLGYIYRFQITYCDRLLKKDGNCDKNDHFNKEKCEAKSKKYTDRLNDAIKLYNSNLINNIKKDKQKRSSTNSNSAETVQNEFKNSNLKSNPFDEEEDGPQGEEKMSSNSEGKQNGGKRNRKTKRRYKNKKKTKRRKHSSRKIRKHKTKK